MNDDNKPRWISGDETALDAFPDDGILAVVETDSGTEWYVCRVDDTGQLVDLEYGDDYGWSYEAIDRWYPLENVDEILQRGDR